MQLNDMLINGMKQNAPQRWAIFTPLMTAVVRTWRRSLNQLLGNHDLSFATALPLITLLRSEGWAEGLRQCELAEYMGIEGSALVRILDGLERDKLLERRPDSSDRRARLLVLTEEGRKVGDRVETLLSEFREKMLSDVDPDDVDAAIRVLTILADRLGVANIGPGKA